LFNAIQNGHGPLKEQRMLGSHLPEAGRMLRDPFDTGVHLAEERRDLGEMFILFGQDGILTGEPFIHAGEYIEDVHITS
jgi:hypothetical protein